MTVHTRPTNRAGTHPPVAYWLNWTASLTTSPRDNSGSSTKLQQSKTAFRPVEIERIFNTSSVFPKGRFQPIITRPAPQISPTSCPTLDPFSSATANASVSTTKVAPSAADSKGAYGGPGYLLVAAIKILPNIAAPRYPAELTNAALV